MSIVVHDKGIMRMIPDLKIEKGKWYYGFICKKCSAKIIAVDAPSQNTNPVVWIGEGKFSVPCRSCKSDDVIFETKDFVLMQADQDEVTSNKFKRTKPSNSPRQKAVRRYPKAKPTFGIRFIEDRPECAIIIARCVAGWSYIENEIALLLASILRINTEPVLAMFLAISNSATQTAVISAAAEVVLTKEDFELFDAMMNLVRKIGDERNHLVHGLYGGSMLVERGILWTEKKHQAAHTATVLASDHKTMETEYLKEVFVYEPEDLETVAQSIEWLHGFLGQFRGYVGKESVEQPQWRAARYLQLCAEPRISAELAILRKRHEKTR